MLFFIFLGLLFIVLVGVLYWLRTFYRQASWPGGTPKETAGILVHDLKFGMRATEMAITFGDQILPFLLQESQQFSLLNGRNTEWLADVLGGIQTQASREILEELYSRTEPLARLVGAIGLAQHGVFLDEINPEHFLVQTVQTDPSQAEMTLAIIALGWIRNPAALPYLFAVLQPPPHDYWYDAEAALALSRIGAPSAILVLRDCLQRVDFAALPETFRALVALGDRQAVPLGIARVSPDLARFNSGFLVRELETITDQKFGYNQKAWLHWWDSVQSTWQVPQEYIQLRP